MSLYSKESPAHPGSLLTISTLESSKLSYNGRCHIAAYRQISLLAFPSNYPSLPPTTTLTPQMHLPQ